MKPGPIIRRLFGRHERTIARLYRRLFVDLHEQARLIIAHLPTPKRVVEIGCGDGLFCDYLRAALPAACELVGLDPVVQTPGRLSRAAGHIRFLGVAATDLCRDRAYQGAFDGVVLGAVLHHIGDVSEQRVVLEAAARLCAPKGVLAVREMVRGYNLPFAAAYLSCTYLTGDRTRFLSDTELRSLLAPFGCIDTMGVPPWTRTARLYIVHRDGSGG